MVAGGDGVEAETHPPVEEGPELEVAVALDTGVRRPSGGVRMHVRSDDAPVELLGEVEDVVVDPETICHPPGVVDIRHGAATRIRGAAPELHGGTDDVVTLLAQNGGGDGGVDPTGEGDEDTHADSFSERCDIEGIWRRRQLSILFVTHEVREAVRLGDRVVLLSSRPGRVIGEFPVEFGRPRGMDSAQTVELAVKIKDRLREEVISHGN